MRGFVRTPDETVDLMVSLLFRNKRPARRMTLLDPGCGDGALIAGVLRWCQANDCEAPEILGIEMHPERARDARRRFAHRPEVRILCDDFLLATPKSKYDFIVANPPYVPITELGEAEKSDFRARFRTAQGRFDLYILFFEQALENLQSGGRLVFITPEKFLYVQTASTLRQLLAARSIEEIRLLDEGTFGGLATYPTITVLNNHLSSSKTKIVDREGYGFRVRLPTAGTRWVPFERDKHNGDIANEQTLSSICLRISCGVATGADSVFVHRTSAVSGAMLRFAHPTISGRQLGLNNPSLMSDYSMLVPYHRDGSLMKEIELGEMKGFLSVQQTRRTLLARTCVKKKPWYAFHENPPLEQLLKPKILCKDITNKPFFWIDREGTLIPRHSVYYIVPSDSVSIDSLCDYLNSQTVSRWLKENCQHATNGFLRVQSNVLKRLPLPASLGQMRTARTRRTTYTSRLQMQLDLLQAGRSDCVLTRGTESKKSEKESL